jgi:hypothetical protein
MQGSCLCGAVGYEVAEFSGPIVNCACRTCQKAHAAAYNTSVRAQREAFRWTRGQDKLGGYESTPGKTRHFCAVCGSHLMAEWHDRAEVIVRVATLDGDPGLRPSATIWSSHASPWLADDPSFAHYPELPPPA